MNPSVQFLLTRVLPVLCLAFGLYLVGAGTLDLIESTRAASWPVTPGVITRSEIVTTDDPQLGRPDRHQARIEYAYRVGHREWTGRRIRSVDTGSSRRSDAEELVSRYPAGGQVAVRHHPTRPERSVLEAGFHWDLLPTLGLGLFPLLFGIAFLLGTQRRAPR